MSWTVLDVSPVKHGVWFWNRPRSFRQRPK